MLSAVLSFYWTLPGYQMMFDYQDGCEWVNEFLMVPAHQGSLGQMAAKRVCMCVARLLKCL